MGTLPDLIEKRISNFLTGFLSRVYEDRVPLSAIYTQAKDPIPFEDISDRWWRDIEVGQRWGGNWESAWLKLTGRVPKPWAGAEVMALVDTGSEACVFDAKGSPVCGLMSTEGATDPLKRKGLVPIARKAKGGEPVELLVEAAANVLFGHVQECRLQEACLVRFRRDVWDLWHDMMFLWNLHRALPGDSPKRARIRYLLNKVLNTYGSGDRRAVAACRDLLAPELAKPANASAHSVSGVGHAHIDVAWLWPLRETVRKTGRTFASALHYMSEYPDYVFGASQAQLYAFCKERYPTLYKRVQDAAKKGRWEVQGAMWVEADCNVTSGESLVRQVLHGKRFFEDEFGVDIQVLWLPDVFGYSAALPQILKKAGVDYFTTQKISWNQFNKFPYHTFLWEGIDGTRIFSHFPPCNTYNSNFDAGQMISACKNFAEKDRASRWLCLFGWGDGGGGPSRHQLELAQRMRSAEELPKVTQEHGIDFFRKAEADIEDIPVWRGELYLELHRGTLTTQAHNKRMNRISELLLRDAELVRSLDLTEYPAAELDRLWKLVLCDQFHDVIPGSSISWVYKDSAKDYEDVTRSAGRLLEQGAAKLAKRVDTRGPGRPVLALNSLSWGRDEVVEIPLDKSDGSTVTVCDGSQSPVPTQIVKRKDERLALAKVTTPSMGHSVLFVTTGRKRQESSLKVSEKQLENEHLLVKLDSSGALTRVYDKINDREVLASGARGNVLTLYEDQPAAWDAWDVDIYYEQVPIAETELVKTTVIERGPVVAGLRQVRKIGDSKLIQEIRLAAGSARLTFSTWADWRESHKMLRVAFPVSVRSDVATFEIQYGHVQRPTHRNTSWDLARFEVVAHKWADLSEPGYGVALLNDCKYGHKIHENVIDLNLLRSPKHPDPEADMGEHEFTYALLPHAGDFREGNVIREAYQLNCPVRAFTTSAHSGDVPSVLSRFSVDAPNVVIEAVKRCETEDALILRAYEAWGQRCHAALSTTLPIRQAFLADIMERNQEKLTLKDGQANLAFGPLEIHTLKLVL